MEFTRSSSLPRFVLVPFFIIRINPHQIILVALFVIFSQLLMLVLNNYINDY